MNRLFLSKEKGKLSFYSKFDEKLKKKAYFMVPILV